MILGNRKWIEIELERDSYFYKWGINIWTFNCYRFSFGKYQYKHTQKFHEEFVRANFALAESEKILRGEI